MDFKIPTIALIALISSAPSFAQQIEHSRVEKIIESTQLEIQDLLPHWEILLGSREPFEKSRVVPLSGFESWSEHYDARNIRIELGSCPTRIGQRNGVTIACRNPSGIKLNSAFMQAAFQEFDHPKFNKFSTFEKKELLALLTFSTFIHEVFHDGFYTDMLNEKKFDMVALYVEGEVLAFFIESIATQQILSSHNNLSDNLHLFDSKTNTPILSSMFFILQQNLRPFIDIEKGVKENYSHLVSIYDFTYEQLIDFQGEPALLILNPLVNVVEEMARNPEDPLYDYANRQIIKFDRLRSRLLVSRNSLQSLTGDNAQLLLLEDGTRLEPMDFILDQFEYWRFRIENMPKVSTQEL